MSAQIAPASAPEKPARSLWADFGLVLYYFFILMAVVILHCRGGLDTPPFIYQGF
jgi:hypothetical protein